MGMDHKIKIPGFFLNSKLGKHLASLQASNSRILAPLFILIALSLIVAGIFILRALVDTGSAVTFSGTIEATEFHLGSEQGGRVDRVDVIEGEKVEADQVLLVVRGERVRSPVDGVVLERSIEPFEIAAPGGALVTVANLDSLTLTVYVPEDRYGKIFLGQPCRVTVDSYPDVIFSGTVSHIADQAEFTPRNIQTVDSRKSTVFAIRLNLAPSNGKLKPGMPADVLFQFSP
jgi:multidrug resistance efflux pump